MKDGSSIEVIFLFSAGNLLASWWRGRDNRLRPKPERVPMAAPKRFKDARNDDLPAELLELGELLETIDSKHRDELLSSYNRVTESVLRRRRILGLVQEALSQLRLDVKYLMFDLEMTRRERDELRERIEGEDRGF